MLETDNLSFHTSFVDLILLVMQNIPAVPNCLALYTNVGGLGAKFENSCECISTLKFQVSSKDAKINVDVSQVDILDSLKGSAKKVIKGASLMSAAICEHGLQICSDQTAFSSTEVALLQAQSLLQDVCTFRNPFRKR